MCACGLRSIIGTTSGRLPRLSNEPSSRFETIGLLHSNAWTDPGGEWRMGTLRDMVPAAARA